MVPLGTCRRRRADHRLVDRPNISLTWPSPRPGPGSSTYSTTIGVACRRGGFDQLQRLGPAASEVLERHQRSGSSPPPTADDHAVDLVQLVAHPAPQVQPGFERMFEDRTAGGAEVSSGRWLTSLITPDQTSRRRPWVGRTIRWGRETDASACPPAAGDEVPYHGSDRVAGSRRRASASGAMVSGSSSRGPDLAVRSRYAQSGDLTHAAEGRDGCPECWFASECDTLLW